MFDKAKFDQIVFDGEVIPPVVAPTVTTQAVTSIAKTTATGNGNITDDGGDTGATRGMCWNTSGTPTTSDSHATNGTGAGAYTVPMTGLTAGQHYYVRAYSINSAGTSYGAVVQLDTVSEVTKTITSESRIKQIDLSKTISAKARLKGEASKAISAKADIRGLGISKTIEALSRIEGTVSKTIQPKARLKQIGIIKTIQSRARVLRLLSKLAQGKARIEQRSEEHTSELQSH